MSESVTQTAPSALAGPSERSECGALDQRYAYTPTLEVGGVTVEADSGALDQFGRLHFISLRGSKSRVKTVTSNLWIGNTAALQMEPLTDYQSVSCPRGWEFRRDFAMLTPEVLHSILTPKRADLTRLEPGEFTIVLLHPGPGRAERTPADVYLAYLRKQVKIPLIDEWREWLFERGRLSGEIAPLRCWGAVCEAYTCHGNPPRLETDLKSALKGDLSYGDITVQGLKKAV